MYLLKNVKIYLAIIIALISFIFAATVASEDSAPKENNSAYRMTIEDNRVVLYRGESFVTVYSGIVPDNLPSSDRNALKAGILFKTRGEADRAAEDFDG